MIIFVYNAETGLFNKLTDFAHKLLSPETYECHLCGITYSNVGMRREWRAFVEGLGVPVKFMYRNEIREVYGISDATLPAIFREEDGELKLWIDADEINGCEELQDLMALITQKMTSSSALAHPGIRPMANEGG